MVRGMIFMWILNLCGKGWGLWGVGTIWFALFSLLDSGTRMWVWEKDGDLYVDGWMKGYPGSGWVLGGMVLLRCLPCLTCLPYLPGLHRNAK